ncbi:MAG: VanW family protein [Clostridia bacterium]|nr:VanW family protein [Clostridia bacterium]
MNNIKKFLLLFAIVFCVLLTGCAKDGHVAANVFVKGVDIGEMSREEAIKALGQIKMNDSERVSINADGKSFTLTAEEIGAEYDVEKTVDAAIEKSKGLFSGWVKTEYIPEIKIDQTKLDKAISEKLGDRETHVVETVANITEEGIEVTNGTSGVQINRTEALDKIKQELMRENKQEIKLSIVKTAPKAVDYDAFLSSFGSEYKEGGYILNTDGTITVTESMPGCEFDKAEATKIMKSHTKEGEAYLIPCKVNLPAFTKEEMEAGLLRDTLASFTTSYTTSSANRCENIRLASEAINGTLMMPGDVFSFNDALGERTKERGYKPAGAYAAGKTVTEVGGGICQVSSTLYNTVLLSNLEIVERRSHQMTVSYVRVGRDATVNWGTTDFKFKNNTGHPIKIVSEISGKTIKISIVGMNTIPDMKVDILTSTVSVIPPTEEIVEDPEKEVGYTETEKGSNGYVVDAVRVVYSGDKEVSRENLTRSRYNPTKTIVTVGTKQPEGVTMPETGTINPDDDTIMPPGLLPEGEAPTGVLSSDTGL